MEGHDSGKHPQVGKKGNCFLLFIVFFFIFVILLVWVYQMNFQLDF